LGPIDPPQADGTLVEPPLPADTLPLELSAGCIGALPFGPPCLFSITYPALSAGPAQDSVAGLSLIVLNASDFFKQSSPPQQLSVVVLETSSGAGPSSNEFTIYLAGQ
jgi:hypothetical protein